MIRLLLVVWVIRRLSLAAAFLLLRLDQRRNVRPG